MIDFRVVLINSITSFVIGYAFHHYQMAVIDRKLKEHTTHQDTTTCSLQQLVHLNNKLDELVGVVNQNCITEF
jgi:hypothetical protein